MNDEMKKRLLDYARSRIQERQDAFRLRGGNNVQVDGKVVSAISSPAVIPEAPIEETWTLVIWGAMVVVDSDLGTMINIPFPERTARVPRVSGLVVRDSFWQSSSLVDDSIPPTRTRTTLLTLEAKGHPTLFPTYGEPGMIDPGPVIATIEEWDGGGAVVATHEMDVLPGGSTQLFTASIANAFTTLRLVSVRRKR